MAIDENGFYVAPDDVTEGLALLINQYKGRIRITEVLTALLLEVQYINNDTLATVYSFLLDSAVGDQLDKLGAIVGQGRQGMLDSLYRTFIKGKIAVNRSNGWASDMINIASLLDPAPTYQELYPATIRIELSQQLSDYPNVPSILNTELNNVRTAINTLLLQGKPAGVSLDVIDTWIGGDLPFVLSSVEPGIFPGSEEGAGLSSIHGDVTSGKLVSKITNSYSII